MSSTFTDASGRDSPPVVSVIIPAYNIGYIGEALESVFTQTFRDYEVIVVNDGSPETMQLEKTLLKYQHQIHYFEQKNRGISGARNTGIRNARGEFLAFLDSDDLWLPEFLAEQLKFFAENPSFDMVCADCIYFGNTELTGRTWQILDPIDNPATFEKVLPTHGGAFASFALLRRETVLKVGFFEEELRLLEDYEYWLRLLYRGGRLAYLPKVLGKRRVHSESLTFNPEVIIPNAVIALRKLENILDPASQAASLVRKEIAFATAQLSLTEGRRRLLDGDYEGSKGCLAKAHAALPSRKVALAMLGLRWAPRWTRWAIASWRGGLPAHSGDHKKK
jgi:glycosyltransferase involved in cell wall biosynthesis